MNKLQYFFSCFLLLLVTSCQKDIEVKQDFTVNEQLNQGLSARYVSPAEYGKLTDFEKEVANLVNTSIGALEGMNVNNNSTNFVAAFTIHKPLKAQWDRAITFYQKENNTLQLREEEDDGGGSCHISGFSSAVSCVKSIASFVNDNGGCANIHVSKDAKGEYNVTWTGC